VDELARTLREQAGVISRGQALELGLSPVEVTRLVRRREWVPVHRGVYVEHDGPLTWLQRAWAAVLYSWPSALTLDSAVRAAEGPGRRVRDESVVHVAVEGERQLVAPAGVRVHRVAGLDALVQWNLGPPRIRYEHAVLDLAASSRSELDAIGVLAAACGGRRTTAARLLEVQRKRPWLPHRDWIAGILGDVAQGTCSVLEHGYLTRVERPHRLPAGRRQDPQANGTRAMFRDVLYDEVGLVVELDGRLFHSSTEERDRDRDLERDLEAVVDRTEETVRLGYGQVFDRGCATAAKVARILQRRGWAGEISPCAKCGGFVQPG
jgi:hypothetical protein